MISNFFLWQLGCHGCDLVSKHCTAWLRTHIALVKIFFSVSHQFELVQCLGIRICLLPCNIKCRAMSQTKDLLWETLISITLSPSWCCFLSIQDHNFTWMEPYMYQRSFVSSLVTHRFSDVRAKFPEIQPPPFRLSAYACCIVQMPENSCLVENESISWWRNPLMPKNVKENKSCHWRWWMKRDGFKFREFLLVKESPDSLLFLTDVCQLCLMSGCLMSGGKWKLETLTMVWNSHCESWDEKG